MTDEQCRELGIMTETEKQQLDQRLDAMQIVGITDLVKYFDRINDKLFQLNNMIKAGHFALIIISPNTSSWIILIPIVNFFILLFVDWQMMEKSRLPSPEVKHIFIVDYCNNRHCYNNFHILDNTQLKCLLISQNGK